MSEKRGKYTGFGSRIKLDTLRPKITSKEATPRDNLNVDMSYFTVKVNPTGDHKIKVEEESERSFGQGLTVQSRPSPTNTSSEESFKSCRSTSSKPEEREEGRREASGSGTTGSSRHNHSQDEDLFNQLTIVNAIFLNNSVGQCVHEDARDAQGDKRHHRKSSCSTSNGKFQDKCAEDGLDSFMRNVCGDNASTQRSMNNDAFAYYSADSSLRERKWSPKMNSFKPYSRDVKRVDSVTSISCDDSGQRKDKTSDKLDVGSTKLSTRIPGLVSMGTRETVSDQGGSKLLDASGNKKFKTRMVMRKSEISSGERVQFVETYFLKQSFVELLPKMDLDKPIDIKLKDRDCCYLGKRAKVKTLKRLEKVDKRALVKNLKLDKHTDPWLVSSIANIMAPPSNPVAKEDKKDSTEVGLISSVVPNLPTKAKMVISLTPEAAITDRDTADVDPPSSDDVYHHNAVSENAVGEELEKASVCQEQLPLYDESVTIDDMPDIVYMKENLASVRRRSRRALRLRCPLPVIREESSESLESNDSEESNKSDDYCLVDDSGRTMHLFDENGMPLTDNCGRPLRDAEGQTLMRCDSQGVPLVDASASVFDHCGHHALDPRFSPWGSAPVPPALRLCAPSGLPLLLFDSRGLPLTSAGGELLLDRAGRPLLTLNV